MMGVVNMVALFIAFFSAGFFSAWVLLSSARKIYLLSKAKALYSETDKSVIDVLSQVEKLWK